MHEIIMGYQGEMSLKGLNRNQFESAMMKILRYRLKTVGKFKVYCTQSTFYMEPEEEDVDMDLAFDRVSKVFGLAALSRSVVCDKDFDTICQTAEDYLGASLHGIRTFKVEARRSDKSYPMTSPELMRELGGESDLEYRVRDLLENANPTAAIYCKTGECEIRITARAENDTEAEKMCRAYATKFYDLLGDAVYDEDAAGLEETLVHTLQANGLTLATAESCTGGMIAQRITNVSGSSGVFGFGFVTYWEQAKAQMIGVDPAVIDKYNVVSAPVAAQMALGAAATAGADIAVSVTGVAGPTGGDAVRPVGTVYLGAARGDTVYVKKLFVSRPDRALVRARAAQTALELALRLAQGKVPADTTPLDRAAQHDAAALDALDAGFLKK